MSTSKTTTKSEPAPVEADPMAEELAAMRAELETVKAALGRLQELTANAVLWAGCPCGKERNVFNPDRLIILDGRLWHDRGHHSFYAGRGATE